MYAYVPLRVLGLVCSVTSLWSSCDFFQQAATTLQVWFEEFLVYAACAFWNTTYSGGSYRTVPTSTWSSWSVEPLPLQFLLPLLASLLYFLVFLRVWRKSLASRRQGMGKRSLKRLQRCAPQVLHRLQRKRRHVSVATEYAQKLTWCGYFLRFGCAATSLNAWMTSAYALQLLWWEVHARTPSECRLQCTVLCILAARGCLCGQCLGVYLSMSIPFLMPSARRTCWSCAASWGDEVASWAVSKPSRDKDACELGLCLQCWQSRSCKEHEGGVVTFLEDMPLTVRRVSKSQHRPMDDAVRANLSLCTVCEDCFAAACGRCLSPAERRLREQGLLRCRRCMHHDLVVKGDPKNDAQSRFACGTCTTACYRSQNHDKTCATRGSCSTCHLGRQCPTCSEYCLLKKPPSCKNCSQQRPAQYRVAV